jgi:formyl-CoA transferase
MGGLMSVTGPPGQGPWRAGIAVSDTASGTFLTQGVLAALFARERSGRGQWVHTSLLESMVNFMDFQATRWLIDGEIPRQAGNDHPTIFPMGTLATQDGHINVAPVMGWKRFLTAIDGEEVDADPRFCDATLRSRNRKELQQVLERKLACRTSAEWTEILNAADIACGPVYSLDEVFSDPQVVHLALTRKVDHPNDGSLEVLRHPVTLSETPTAVTRAAPVPGAHTREVLAECGFTPSEIDDLVDSGAAACEGRGTMFR